MHFITKDIKTHSPNIDDSIKPDFRVFWINKFSRETGHSTFFTYEYGMGIIEAVFKTMYPCREILQISEIADPKAS